MKSFVLPVLWLCTGLLAIVLGAFYNLLIAFAAAAAAFQIGQVVYFAVRRQRQPADTRHWLTAAWRWIFWLGVAVTVRMAAIREQLGARVYAELLWVMLGLVALNMLLALWPRPGRRWPMNVVLGLGALFMGVECTLARTRETVAATEPVLANPFHRDAFVVQGGVGRLINHHYPERGQRHALDLACATDGREYKTDRRQIESFWAWGETIYAPIDGEVVAAIDDFVDAPLGRSDRRHPAGNQIILRSAANRYVVLAHLQHGSMMVKPGERVQRGHPLARCGKSGNASVPHLHLQVQDRPDPLPAKVETFPIAFAGANGFALRRGEHVPGVPAAR